MKKFEGKSRRSHPVITYFLFLLLNIFILNIVLTHSVHDAINISRDQSISVVEKTIDEFNEIDLQHLCTITNCSAIQWNDLSYKKADFRLEQIDRIESVYYDYFELSQSFGIIVEIKKLNLKIIKNSKVQLINLIESYMYINIYFILIYTFIFIWVILISKRRNLLDKLDTSNSLREKNMQILTENIHHELNTPLAIVHGNIRKLEIEMGKLDNYCILFNFEQMYASIDQIDTVLQRMSNFKNLKYSNGNKSLHDILAYSVNSMSIYKKSNFDIELDIELKEYKLNKPMRNADLLNVVSNHLRNSIDATSTKIVISQKYNYKTKKMHIFITDNGNGLRDKQTGLLLNKDKYNDIFKLHYTSKNKEGESKVVETRGFFYDGLIRILHSIYLKKDKITNEVRGVGLYLNKTLLNENNGDVKLRTTSEKGTVFEIIIPVLRK